MYKNTLYALLFAIMFGLIVGLQFTMEPFRLYAVDAPLAVLFAVVLISIGNRKKFYKSNPTDHLVMLLAIALSISYVFSFDIYHSTVQYLDWMKAIFLYYSIRIISENRLVQISEFLGFVKVITAIIVLIGIVQLVTDSDFGLIANYFGESEQESYIANLNSGEVKRISGTISKPIIYGLWIYLFGGLLFAALMLNRKYFLSAVVFCSLLVAVISTLSRGAVSTLVVGMFITFFIVFSRIKNAIKYPALILIISVASLPTLLFFQDSIIGSLSERTRQVEDLSRINMAVNSINILQNPKVLLFGVGPGNFHPYTSSIGQPSTPEVFGDWSKSRSGVHNSFLRLISEYGLFVFMFVLVISYRFFRMARVVLKINVDKNNQALAVHVIGGMLSIAFIGAQVYEEFLDYQMLFPISLMLAYLTTAYKGK